MILSAGFGGGYSKRNEKRSSEQAHKIADETGGEVLIPESQKQLALNFQRLASDLQPAYRLTCQPTSATSLDKSKQDKIRLETTRGYLRLIHQKAAGMIPKEQISSVMQFLAKAPRGEYLVANT